MTRIPKILKFNEGAREKVLEGINLLADAVSTTLGPRGQNVAIGQPHGYPQVIHDGVTVAGNIDLHEPFADIGVQLIKGAAQKTNDVAGDGTTTATILARAIVVEAMKHIQAGINPMQLKKEIEDSLEVVLEELKKLTKKITTEEEIKQIATISSTDESVGDIISEAIKQVGDKGLISVEEGNATETSVEYKKGMEIDRGYLSPYFVTDNTTVEAIVDDPYILITDHKLNHNHELVPFLEMFLKAKKSKNLVIIAGEVVEQALHLLVVNKLQKALNIVAIQAPAFGDRRKDELEDIATLTGGKAIIAESGRNLDSVVFEELGTASKVIADRDKSKIISGGGDIKAIEARVKEIKGQLTLANTEYDKEIKSQRISKMIGKVAVINVGAVTEVEMRDKKERIIDAKNATMAAIEEGIVAGGQLTLLSISVMPFWAKLGTPGAKILQQAIKEPFKKLIENAGMDYAEVWGKLSPLKYPVGIDVIDGKKKDLIKSGIIDPVKVERSALENAVSVATMLISTKVLVVDDPDAKEK